MDFLRKKFWKSDRTMCILKHAEMSKIDHSTPKDCNAIYVRDIRDHNNLQYTQDGMVEKR